jgi:hypothetical protein
LDPEEVTGSVGSLHEANDAIAIEDERGKAAYSEGCDHGASRVDDETLVHTVALGPGGVGRTVGHVDLWHAKPAV